MIPSHQFLVAIAVAALLAGCVDAPTMLAGGVKGFCKGSGSAPCTRPPPGNMPNTPPR